MPVDAWLENDLPGLLAAFLPTQRWFGGKARRIQVVDIEDAVWLTEVATRSVLVVIGVRFTDGARERYVMLLALVREQTRLPALGRIEHADADLWVVEAATDAHAAVALLRGFASQREVPMGRGGTLRYGDAGAVAERGIARAAKTGSVTPLGAEQSNTSVRLDEALVFKLFRRLDRGENPELEVGRFLATRTTFRAMPELRGSLTYVSASGESSTIGILQDWIPSLGDAWTHVVTLLRQSATRTSDQSLARDLFALGVTTADLHAALATDTADPAFAPEPVTPADLQAWRASLLERAARTFRLLERQVDGWTGTAHRLGRAVLDLRGRTPALMEVPDLTTSGGFHKIRVHGDYHLGQILRTSQGFAVIDFEGEPARPLTERRRKHCALKDVAGMIRSVDYAVAAAFEQDPTTPNTATRSRRLRESFLDGYFTFAITRRAVFLPPDRQATDVWIDFFEVEKALYEVEYEINNRPAWATIPLRGILRLLRRRA